MVTNQNLEVTTKKVCFVEDHSRNISVKLLSKQPDFLSNWGGGGIFVPPAYRCYSGSGVLFVLKRVFVSFSLRFVFYHFSERF